MWQLLCWPVLLLPKAQVGAVMLPQLQLELRGLLVEFGCRSFLEVFLALGTPHDGLMSQEGWKCDVGRFSALSQLTTFMSGL